MAAQSYEQFLTDNKDKLNLSGNLVKTKLNIEEFKDHTRTFVKVQDGCNNRCTYCCVWMARGTSHSRDREQILNEVNISVSSVTPPCV